MPGVMQRNGHVDGYHGYDDRRSYSNHDPRYPYEEDYRREPQYSGRRADPYRYDRRDDPPYRTNIEPETGYRIDDPEHPSQRMDQPYPRSGPLGTDEYAPSPPSPRRDNPYSKQAPPPVGKKPTLPTNRDDYPDKHGMHLPNERTNADARMYQNFPPRYTGQEGDYDRKVPHAAWPNQDGDIYRQGGDPRDGYLRLEPRDESRYHPQPPKIEPDYPEHFYNHGHSNQSEPPAPPYGGRRVLPTPGLVDMYPNQRAPESQHQMNPPSPDHDLRKAYEGGHQNVPNARPDPGYRDPSDLYSHVHKGPVTNGNDYPPRSGPYYPGDHDGMSRDRDIEASNHELDHLATFTVSQAQGLASPEQGIRRLRQMETSTGIWTMRCTLVVERHNILIIDRHSGDQIECFPLSLVMEPTAVTNQDRRDIYNNILLFIVVEDPKKRSDQSEMHLFQCLSRPASQVVDEILDAQQGKFKPTQGLPRQRGPEPRMEPPELAKSVVPDRIREYEMAAQQAAMATSKYQPGPPPGRAFRQSLHHDDNESTHSERTERDVQLLNHCIDDIEIFVRRLQEAANKFKELQQRKDSRSKKKKVPTATLR